MSGSEGQIGFCSSELVRKAQLRWFGHVQRVSVTGRMLGQGEMEADDLLWPPYREVKEDDLSKELENKSNSSFLKMF